MKGRDSSGPAGASRHLLGALPPPDSSDWLIINTDLAPGQITD